MKDVEQVAKVFAALLDCDYIEPTDDLRDQRSVLVSPLLCTQIGDIPGGNEQLVFLAFGNGAGLLVFAHPWITFSMNLSQAPAILWVILGECNSLCRFIAGAPLLPEDRDMLYDNFLVRSSIAITGLDSNLLKEEEVRQLLMGTISLPPSQKYIAQQIHAGLIEKTQEGLRAKKQVIKAFMPLTEQHERIEHDTEDL